MLSLVPQIFAVKKKIADFIRKIKELPTISNCDASDFAAMGFFGNFLSAHRLCRFYSSC